MRPSFLQVTLNEVVGTAGATTTWAVVTGPLFDPTFNPLGAEPLAEG